MKVKNDFLLRNVAGKYIVVPVGEEAIDFNGLITTNETGAFIWDCLKTDISIQDIVDKMLAEYDIDSETAQADVNAFINKLREARLITE